MPKIILFSDYIKPSNSSHLVNSINYIAESDSAELNQFVNLNSNEFATDKQTHLIESIVNLHPKLSSSFEYKNFLDDPTIKTASDFISSAQEILSEDIMTNVNYLNYIAKRKGVELSDGKSHGLFGKHGAVSLPQYRESMRDVQGNVFRHVVAIKYEDAVEVGFTQRNAWESMVRKEMDKVGMIHNIEPDDLDWVCAFHKSDTHPHVHIMVWSKSGDPNVFLKSKGIEKIKGTFGKNIYPQEYKKYYEHKESFWKDMSTNLKSLDFRSNNFIDSLTQKNINKLNSLIPQDYSGRWSYGFMKPKVKETIDQIIDDLITNQPAVKKMFDDYVESQIDFLSMYGTKTTYDEIKREFVSPGKYDKKPFHNLILEVYKNNYSDYGGLSITNRQTSTNDSLEKNSVLQMKDKSSGYLDVVKTDDEFVYVINQKTNEFERLRIDVVDEQYDILDLKVKSSSHTNASVESNFIEVGDYMYSYVHAVPFQIVSKTNEQVFLYSETFDMGVSIIEDDLSTGFALSTLEHNALIGNEFVRLVNPLGLDKEILTLSDDIFSDNQIEKVVLKTVDGNHMEVLPCDFNLFKLHSLVMSNDISRFNRISGHAIGSLLNKLSNINKSSNLSRSSTVLEKELERGARDKSRLIEKL